MSFNRMIVLFPARHGGHMAPGTLYKVFYRARDKAGRPDLRFHDLRHTGAALSAQVGATVAELMDRLGHSTGSAAMRYQHAAEGRGQVIATALSDIATGGDRGAPAQARQEGQQARLGPRAALSSLPDPHRLSMMGRQAVFMASMAAV